MKKILVLILICSYSLMSYAQDSEYIQDFSHKINVKLGIDTNVFSYKVTNSSDNSFYELKPNASVRLTSSLHYKFLGLTIGYTPGFISDNSDEVLKGSSDINSIKLRLFIKQFIQEFSYYRIEGFYVENTSDYVTNWIKDTDPYIQLKSLNLKRYGGKTDYVWNDRFSYKALVVQNQKQQKSIGSFIPSISYFYSELANPDNNFITINESTFDFNLNAGYIHNFVFGREHNYFASLGLSPGLGVKFAKTIEEDEFGMLQETKETHPNFSFEGRLNLGYNSDKIFTGLQFNAFGVTYNKTPETKVEDSNTYFQLYFGYRFGAPKGIENFFNKIKL